jgi:hypothetical protein
MYTEINRYIDKKYDKVIQYYKDYLDILKKIEIIKNKNLSDDMNIIIQAYLAQNEEQDVEQKMPQMDEQKMSPTESLTKINYQQQIEDIINKYCYLNVIELTNPSEEILIDTSTKINFLGMDYAMEKYGFNINRYKYSILADEDISLSDEIHWTFDTNATYVDRISNSKMLFSCILAIDEKTVPHKYASNILDDKYKLIYIINIELPHNKQDPQLPHNKQELKTKYILYIFYDKTTKTIEILNNRERKIVPPDFKEDYLVTYNEFRKLMTLNLKIFRHRIYKWLFITTPSNFSSYVFAGLLDKRKTNKIRDVQEVGKKYTLYDDFIEDFEPVYFIREDDNEIIIVDKTFTVVGHSKYNPYDLESKPKAKEHLKRYVPLHESIC